MWDGIFSVSWGWRGWLPASRRRILKQILIVMVLGWCLDDAGMVLGRCLDDARISSLFLGGNLTFRILATTSKSSDARGISANRCNQTQYWLKDAQGFFVGCLVIKCSKSGREGHWTWSLQKHILFVGPTLKTFVLRLRHGTRSPVASWQVDLAWRSRKLPSVGPIPNVVPVQ